MHVCVHVCMCACVVCGVPPDEATAKGGGGVGTGTDRPTTPKQKSRGPSAPATVPDSPQNGQQPFMKAPPLFLTSPPAYGAAACHTSSPAPPHMDQLHVTLSHQPPHIWTSCTSHFLTSPPTYGPAACHTFSPAPTHMDQLHVTSCASSLPPPLPPAQGSTACTPQPPPPITPHLLMHQLHVRPWCGCLPLLHICPSRLPALWVLGQPGEVMVYLLAREVGLRAKHGQLLVHRQPRTHAACHLAIVHACRRGGGEGGVVNVGWGGEGEGGIRQPTSKHPCKGM